MTKKNPSYKAYQAPLILCALIVVAHLVAIILPGNFQGLGIRPRELFGLVGIICSPFLHSGFPHLLANIFPLLVMGYLVCVLNARLFITRTLILMGLSGALTWLISSSDIVIGASGLVFACWSFLITYGLRKRSFKSLLIAIITIVVYGTLLFSLFKYMPGVSWAGHISGAIAGVVLAFLSKK